MMEKSVYMRVEAQRHFIGLLLSDQIRLRLPLKKIPTT